MPAFARCCAHRLASHHSRPYRAVCTASALSTGVALALLLLAAPSPVPSPARLLHPLASLAPFLYRKEPAPFPL
jgi:hypothetical protein